ncbi:PREDICTED: uncharacterized protein LOC105448641 isoform X2 [Wasmannia auropunctata]|uniref:uncharacterized protein LOC105448641 isoform X2 n=1 Tax=Wasmannia auropunctata TaxID=64793 RepID=UPI0005EF5B6E|nr:PREDICTED: uncharacterized protein LOC105448641 isoform X2 [Wasmannia auropunctata]
MTKSMSKREVCGYMSLLYSVADKPLDLWSKHVSYGGKIRRVRDDLLHGDRVIEITGPNNSTIPTSVTIPAKAQDVLNVKLPILVLIVKNLNLRFKLDVQIMDEERYRRRFSFMTHSVERPRIGASLARIPLILEKCWNLLEINLQALCRDAYGTDYGALQRVTIYPNCHLRRVYLQDRHYDDDETRIEMCQAFIDMYMLKRSQIKVVKACQTEECYTEPPEQSAPNCFAKEDSIGTPSAKMDLRKTAGNTEKLKSLNSPNLNLYKSILKKNHMSVDALNGAIKKRNQHIFTRQSERLTKSSINEPMITENKLKKGSSDITEKAGQRYAMKTHKAEISMLNIKLDYRLQPASAVELKRIAKNQFLKTHVSEILFKDNEFPKCPQKGQNAGDTYVNMRNCNIRNCTLSDADNVQTGKDNATVAKFRAASAPSAFKLELSENVKLDKINNVSDNPSDGHVRSKHKYVKESERSIANRLRSLLSIEEDAEDMSAHKYIPSLIEKEAILEEIKSYVFKDSIGFYNNKSFRE